MCTSVCNTLKSAVVIAAVTLLAGCIDTSITINTPTNGHKYVGLSGKPAPNPGNTKTMPEMIQISYEKTDSDFQVYLNGHPIGPLFTVGQNVATLPVTEVEDFLRQGSNILMVEPLSFGPTIHFFFDNDGPLMDVADVDCLDGDCANVNGGQIDLKVRAKDTTSINEVLLITYDYQWDGTTDGGDNNWNALSDNYVEFREEQITKGTSYPLSRDEAGNWVATVPEATLYELRSTDAYGYTSSDFYLSAHEKINNVAKLKVNKSALDSMVPILGPEISDLHLYAPVALANYDRAEPTHADPLPSKILDTMNRFWHQDAIFYGDVGSSTDNPDDCGYINTKTWSGESEGVTFNCTNWDGDHCRDGNWQIPAGIDYKTGTCSRIVMWRLELDKAQNMIFTLDDSEIGMLRLDMEIVEQDKPDAVAVDLGLRDVRCGRQTYCTSENEFGDCVETAYYTDHYCQDIGPVTYLGADMGAMEVTADASSPVGGVSVKINNGSLDLAFADDVSLNLEGTEIGGSMNEYYSWAIGLMEDVLDGLFVNIVESVLQQNLQDFILGADLFLEGDSQDPPDPSMRMQSQAEQVYTNADNDAATETEWFMQYSGFLKALKQPSQVTSVLGSHYVRDEVLAPVDSVSEIDVSVNVNMINQALMSMYRSGVTHITVTNFDADGEPLVHFGPDVSDGFDTVREDDQRVELVPAAPAMFEMDSLSDGSQATVHYRNAQMNVDTYREGAWERTFTANVDIHVGVYMAASDGNLQMTIPGTPKLVVNSVTSSFGSDSMLRQMTQFAIDLVMNVAIPQIAENHAELQFPPIPGPEGSGMEIIISADKIKPNNDSHLKFGLSVDAQPAP